MDTTEFIKATGGLVLAVAVFVTVLNLITYAALAPWHSTKPGRWVMGLLGILALLMGTTAVRVSFGDFDFRQEIIYAAFLLYVASMVYLFVTIVTEQYGGAIRARRLRKQLEKERQHHG